MPKYIIERETPGSGAATSDQLCDIADNSNRVVSELGPELRWLESFVTDDKTYCVFVAPSEDMLLEHARCAGAPVDRISKVASVIDSSWAADVLES